MNLKPVRTTACAFALLAAATLRAQTSATPPPPPPPPPAPYAYNSNPNTGNIDLVADVSAPYAFNFNDVGIVGDLGGVWHNNFLGAEVSYYDARPSHRDWYHYYPGGGYGGSGYNEDITTANLAYRYYIPIPTPGIDPYGANMAFYIGGAAGAGWVHVNPGYGYYAYPGTGPNYVHPGDARFDANGEAGFQWNINRLIALKVGYRYIWVNNAHLFYTDRRLESSAAEAGLAFRF